LSAASRPEWMELKPEESLEDVRGKSQRDLIIQPGVAAQRLRRVKRGNEIQL